MMPRSDCFMQWHPSSLIDLMKRIGTQQANAFQNTNIAFFGRSVWIGIFLFTFYQKKKEAGKTTNEW
jgi:hypothetical protein